MTTASSRLPSAQLAMDSLSIERDASYRMEKKLPSNSVLAIESMMLCANNRHCTRTYSRVSRDSSPDSIGAHWDVAAHWSLAGHESAHRHRYFSGHPPSLASSSPLSCQHAPIHQGPIPPSSATTPFFLPRGPYRPSCPTDRPTRTPKPRRPLIARHGYQRHQELRVEPDLVRSQGRVPQGTEWYCPRDCSRSNKDPPANVPSQLS